MRTLGTIVIEQRFHGPVNSANGGYTCGRLARFIEGPARVRLCVPPPLDVEFDVQESDSGVLMIRNDEVIAEAWPGRPDLDVPDPPPLEEAEAASGNYAGFKSHRYDTCFVCGPQQAAGGLKIFAGPVPGRNLVACPWIPDTSLTHGGTEVDPVYVWSALDCPGGFAFPEPARGSILLGELSVELYDRVDPGRTYVVIGWEFGRQGRKHHTGTALFASSGKCHGVGRAIWFEVPSEQ